MRWLAVAAFLAFAGCGEEVGPGPGPGGDRVVAESECPGGGEVSIIRAAPGTPAPATADETYKAWRDGGSLVTCPT